MGCQNWPSQLRHYKKFHSILSICTTFPSNETVWKPEKWWCMTRQANLCLQAFRHDKFYLRMPSHSEGPGIWLSVWRFLLTHCLYERAAEVLARLRRLAWTFAARTGDKYQIRLTRPMYGLYYTSVAVMLSLWNEPRHEKTCLCNVQTTNAQISLGICPVWSASLLFTAQKVWYISLLSKSKISRL